MDPYSNFIMAPETLVIKTAVQVKVTDSPTIPVELERERGADMIKALGTEEKTKHRSYYTCMYIQTLISRKTIYEL